MIKRILKWTFLLILIGGFVWFEIAYWSSTNNCDQKIAPTNPMKAIVYCDYGLANLKLQDIEKPTPTDDQLLVRVRAASVNPYDWHFIEGSPKIIRLFGIGLRKPKDTRLGRDVAGQGKAHEQRPARHATAHQGGHDPGVGQPDRRDPPLVHQTV